MSAMVRKPCRLECGEAVFSAFAQHAGIGLLHHLLAEVHAHQVVLEDVVVEHVLGGFAQVDDPFGHGRRLDAERHVLRISGAGGVVVAADAADAAGDEVRVARILALHEDAVAAKDGRGAVALGDLAVLEIDLGEDAEAAHDAGDRVPVHLHQLLGLCWSFRLSALVIVLMIIRSSPSLSKSWADSRWSVPAADAATSVPCSPCCW